MSRVAIQTNEHRPAAGISLLRGVRVLLVDDQRDIVSVQALVLEALGQQVERAYDGMEAVCKALAFRPDVVLMDLQMPKMNGIEAVRRMRQLDCMAGARIVAHTAAADIGDDAILKAGFDAVLRKPATLSRLVATLPLFKFP